MPITEEFKKKVTDLRDKGNYNEAIEFLNEALQSDKNDSWIWFTLATNYYGLNNGKMAIECLNEAIKVDPNRASLYYGRGHVYLEMEKLELAIEDAKKAVQFATKNKQDLEDFLNNLLNNNDNDRKQLKLNFY